MWLLRAAAELIGIIVETEYSAFRGGSKYGCRVEGASITVGVGMKIKFRGGSAT